MHTIYNVCVIECMIEQWKLTRILLSRDPDAKNGPLCAPVLLSVPAASLITDAELSGAHAMHSTV